MAMTVLNASGLAAIGRKNAPLRKALDNWLRTARGADWSSLADVRATFPAADGVTIRVSAGIQIVTTVFNIKGNAYRLITVIDFSRAVIRVVDVLTHAEYDKNLWKDRL
jgi:mRNA interferase HigB